ncbi:hypothetical protein BIV57_05705 [Mangrovactinospora gilvigrisea]|uniref:Amino acid permease n=1 Tax=Mangrovactinospora gilvigrisea TaxID=1428644 RepID=A0A1J7BIB8_9ACTN|nr:APC family permease [Mangrovactinospora gilvigrisea]OIV38390.1 hypothetical protein BIV57_05705 [Mangrovactinospora gilvigrisea]
MSIGDVLKRAGLEASPEGEDGSRFSVLGLVGLAAGGMIGSGWLLGAVGQQPLGIAALWAWVLGGALILVLAAVMVELGTAAPRSGGLIFLPLQSSGPLLATVVATALWLFYALNAAVEAVAMTTALAAALHLQSALLDAKGLTVRGELCSIFFMAVISAVNLLGMKSFIWITNVLTLFKIVVPLLVVGLLFGHGFHFASVTTGQEDTVGELGRAWPAVVGGSVLFAYIGFQGPLDFAGDIKRRRLSEATRLRRAVFGALIGTIVLYVLVQFAVLGHRYGIPAGAGDARTEATLAHLLPWGGTVFLVDAVLAPFGAGLVFVRVLSREVAALSSAHLAHRGLRTLRASRITLPGRAVHEAYWVVLLVNFVISCAALLLLHGNWLRIATTIGILALIVYAVPGVVLVALRDALQANRPRSARRLRWRNILARAGFLAVALVLFRVSIQQLAYAMAALAAGSALLLVLPALSRGRLPFSDRLFAWYEAQPHAERFLRWRTEPAVWTVGTLVAYLGGLTLAAFVRGRWADHGIRELGLGLAVLAMAAVAFELLVRQSRMHLAREAPTLPVPRPAIDA